MISAAVPFKSDVLLVTDNDRAFTQTIRSQRAQLAAIMAAVIALSVLLSMFLARTIVRPLRRLALAAHRVRLGRSREVNVPRLPSRSDEIGLLARAVSDMSQSLRQRIDNIEAFAADVTHELKNPLASLRSAMDGLDRVEDPELKRKLIEVAREDVVRLDRLINDISEAARTDAELARARFERVDLGPLIEQLIDSWETRRETGSARIAFARPRKDTAAVMGKPDRLARAINAIIDNAVSFSPADGLVEIAAARVGDEVRIRIDDEGPGVPPGSPGSDLQPIPFSPARRRVFRPPLGTRPCHRPGDCRRTWGRHRRAGPRRRAIGRPIHHPLAGGGPRMNQAAATGAGSRLSAETVHASTVATDGRAVLITGPSGSGKSDLTLRLLDRGFVLGQRRPDRSSSATATGWSPRRRRTSPASSKSAESGSSTWTTLTDQPIALIVELTSEIQRLPDDNRERPILGVSLPLVSIDAMAASAPSKVALALDRLGLKF